MAKYNPMFIKKTFAILVLMMINTEIQMKIQRLSEKFWPTRVSWQK